MKIPNDCDYEYDDDDYEQDLKKDPDVELLMKKLTSAITYHYQSKVAPGIVVSYLPCGEFYVSIVRYGASHYDKVVVHRAQDVCLKEALTKVTQEFVSSIRQKPNPIDELKNLIGRT